MGHLIGMNIQTVTRAIEADIEPARIFARLADPSLLPKWAPVFADSVERTGDLDFLVTKNGDSFAMELVKNESALSVDYLRPMANGGKGGAYIRVTPRPLGGSTVVMTVPVGPATTPAQVTKDLDQELEALVKLSSQG